jgi:hypothetical protein
MVNKGALTVCMILIAFPVYSREKKSAGEIFDQRALTEVRSYCIEKSKLSDRDRYLVEGFLKAESKPRHLLTKMPWKLVESCETGNPDTVATVEFVPLNSTDIRLGQTEGPRVMGTDSRDPDAPIKVVLTVDDSAQKLLYRTQAMPLTNDVTSDSLQPSPIRGGPVERQDALYHVFWQLTDDLRAMRVPK